MSIFSDKINNKFFRKTIAHPDGSVCHDGDCMIFTDCKICNCGLLHDLMMWPEQAPEVYPEYHKDMYEQTEFLATLSELEIIKP